MISIKARPTTPPASPIGGLYDPRFKYVPACKTNVAETFRRIREERARGSLL